MGWEGGPLLTQPTPLVSEARGQLPGVEGALSASWHPASRRALLLCADDKAEKGDEKDAAVVTQADEAPAEEDHLGPNCYYDKSKSFFDNISSELKTRSGGVARGWARGLVRPGRAGRKVLVPPQNSRAWGVLSWRPNSCLSSGQI